MLSSQAEDEHTGQAVMDQDVDAIRQVASALLQQACQFLQEITEREDGERILTHESQYIPGSTIGKHLRHSLDHYRLLVESTPSSHDTRSFSGTSAPLQLNYDVRARLVDMERNPQVALASFQDMDDKLNGIVGSIALDQPIRLAALTPYRHEFNTSFGRELWFVALHAIHHFSLLRVIACGELDLKLPPQFGVAPSTLAFRQVSKSESSDKLSPETVERVAKRAAAKVKL